MVRGSVLCSAGTIQHFTSRADHARLADTSQASTAGTFGYIAEIEAQKKAEAQKKLEADKEEELSKRTPIKDAKLNCGRGTTCRVSR